jgi:hypothetical protein
MHLVGYLYEDYHDARSLEHKVRRSMLRTSSVYNFGASATKQMRTAHFWTIKQRRGLRRATSRVISLASSHSSLRNSPEERSSHPQRSSLFLDYPADGGMPLRNVGPKVPMQRMS